MSYLFFFFFSSRRRHTRWTGDWSSDVCSSDLLTRARRRCTRASRSAREGPRPQHLLELGRGLREPRGRFLPLAVPRASARRQRLRPVGAEIGRAACRERGERSGGGGSFKKKKR